MKVLYWKIQWQAFIILYFKRGKVTYLPVICKDNISIGTVLVECRTWRQKRNDSESSGPNRWRYEPKLDAELCEGPSCFSYLWL